MTPPFPYTFYACPCTDEELAPIPDDLIDEQHEPAQERTFNPHNPLSTYALYTLDHLLFCDDCNQIKCARCTSEEHLHYYCPACLFEQAAGNVKNEGNRCSRSCHACPVCTAVLTVTLLEAKNDGLLKPDGTEEGTYILSCQYCAWSSLDIDLTFEKPTRITDQIKKARKALSNVHDGAAHDNRITAQERFGKLTTFYREQLIANGEIASGPSYGAYNSYSSPAALSRIMNLYGGLSQTALKKSQEKLAPMREAVDEEGLAVFDASTSQDDDTIEKISKLGWDGTISTAQKLAAPHNFDVRLLEHLWPTPVQTKTKRGKRCRQCRSFVVRPEAKINSARYRLRILAKTHIPRLSIRSLDPARQYIDPSFFLKHEPLPRPAPFQPHVPQHFVLTLRNPIFETVKVTLATSATTPGRVASKVTILCPSFTIGPAGDVWDEALSTPSLGQTDGGPKAAMASLTGNNEADRQPEAGKVWEQTRSSTSVVLEIVPGSLSPPPSIVPDKNKAMTPLQEGDDVLEIPVYVRVEWTAELATEGEQKGATERVPKELAYWCVLGVGRIAG